MLTQIKITISPVMEDDIKRRSAMRMTAVDLDIIQGKATLTYSHWYYDLVPSEVAEWVKGTRAVLKIPRRILAAG